MCKSCRLSILSMLGMGKFIRYRFFFFFVESGGRKLNENKALTSKKARLVLDADFG